MPWAQKIDGLRTTMLSAARSMAISKERLCTLDTMLTENCTVTSVSAIKKSPDTRIVMSFHAGSEWNSGVWTFALQKKAEPSADASLIPSYWSIYSGTPCLDEPLG